MNNELTDAIRTGTSEELALLFAATADQRDRGNAVDAANATMLEIAQAIVAARPKVEDVATAWMPWHDDGPNLGHASLTEKGAVDRCVQSGYPHKDICRVTITKDPICPQE